MRIIPLLLLISCLTTVAVAQNSGESILDSVRKNNTTIQANKKYWDARKAEYKIGLTPYDPQVEYDYLFGSPAGAGNQKDFSITQRLDFPSVYKKKKTLSALRADQSELQHQVFRQDILLEAKLLVLQLIYLNKKEKELQRRLKQTTQLAEDYQKKLDKGDATILDINKVKLQRLNINNEVAMNQNEIQTTSTQLASLNGGIPIHINDTNYAALPAIPDFVVLDSMIEANDPIVQAYEQEIAVLRQQVSVQKALNLPKLETGYHSQGILGQSYRGMHAGVTIPLWENKGKRKAAEADVDHATENAIDHRINHRMENRELYEKLEVRKKAMQDYTALLESLNNQALLDKALRLGQITIIQYFQDESYYFSAYDKYLQLEREYHQVLARLYKYAL